ncbi:MAG: DUF4350 domain-containing protein [Pseudomonadales bacterium]|nr:DUF4350 domain-containing protein [Pseudomonadales bacterium]
MSNQLNPAQRQDRTTNFVIVGVIGLLVAGVVYLISEQFESVRMTINKGYTLEAYQNSYLAAQQYLASFDIESKSAVDITEIRDQLEPSDSLLLLNTRLIPEPYHDFLLDWVNQGGHLIVTAHNMWDEDYGDSGDIFLDRLGVKMVTTLNDDVDEVEEAAEDLVEEILGEDDTEESLVQQDSALQNSDDEENSTDINECTSYSYGRLTTVRYAENKPAIQVQFGTYVHLEDISGNALAFEGKYPNTILQYPIGDGMITTITNYRLWTNGNIGWYDHAFFLWLLVGNSNRTWFVFDKDSDSLLTLIERHFMEFFVSAALLLAFWLWYRAKRFGPIVAEPEKARRSLMEHLNANARFNWRHQQMDTLIKGQREEIKLHYSRRHGNYQSQAAMVATLAKASQLSNDEVEWALTCDTPYKEQDFTQLIRRLQRLRNAV